MANLSRLSTYGLLTVGLTGSVVSHAWSQQGQFYTTCIHLTRSNTSMMILLNMGLYLTILTGRLLQRIFFGQLRTLEVEHLYERSWYAVTETCLAATMFRDEFDVHFFSMFGALLFAKIFHWIAQDRVDFMDQSPNLTVSFHIRMFSAMTILGLIDAAMITFAVNHILKRGTSMMVIFAFEYTLLFTVLLATFLKYILHTIDLRSPDPWEDKSMYIFYLDLVVDFVKLVAYFLFFAIIVRHTSSLPLHIIRDLYMTVRSFTQRCRDLVQYRRATSNMNQRYPSATAEELAATDRVCIICREEMDASLGAAAVGVNAAINPDVPKKLPCGHIFHLHCLKSWLERQQSCPTCRRSVLEAAPAPAATPAVPAAAAAEAPQQQQPPIAAAPGLNQQNYIPLNDPRVFPFQQFNPWQQLLRQQLQLQQQQQQQEQASAPPSSSSSSSSSSDPQSQPAPSLMDVQSFPPNFMMDNFPLNTIAGGAPQNMTMPFTLTPLVPLTSFGVPQVYDHITDDQLQLMEGSARSSIIQRIQAVHNVQTQLTGIVTQLTQILQMMPMPPTAAAATEVPLPQSSQPTPAATSTTTSIPTETTVATLIKPENEPVKENEGGSSGSSSYNSS